MSLFHKEHRVRRKKARQGVKCQRKLKAKEEERVNPRSGDATERKIKNAKRDTNWEGETNKKRTKANRRKEKEEEDRIGR